MMVSNRGAARVSVVWMITVLVLFFASLAFAFVATSDLSAEQAARETAVAEKETAVEDLQQEADVARAISRATGWFEAESADPRTDLEVMALSVEGFKDAMGITEQSPKTLQALLPLAEAALKRAKDELATERADKNRYKTELDQARKTIADVTQKKDQELADLRQQIQDLNDKFSTEQQDVGKRLAAAQAQVNELSGETRALRSEKDELAKSAAREKAGLKARLDTLANDLRIVKQPDEPDGKVLATSDDLALAWIDVGANDRLARGTRFRITTSGPRPVFKGWGTVSRLEPSSAEIVLEATDRFNPVVAGDVISNPVYSPRGERQAVLAGRFSSPSRGELAALLARMGIEVQKEIDVRTDYLILGGAVYTDEDGETLEEPIQPTELDAYREAQGRGGINVVPLSDLRGYFVF